MSKKKQNEMLVNGKIFMPQRVSDKYCIEPTRSEEVRKLYTDEYFISLIPEGCYYFAYDEASQKVYSLGRDYKFEVEKKQKQLQDQLALTERALRIKLEEDWIGCPDYVIDDEFELYLEKARREQNE